jgi:hypothetical protein
MVVFMQSKKIVKVSTMNQIFNPEDIPRGLRILSENPELKIKYRNQLGDWFDKFMFTLIASLFFYHSLFDAINDNNIIDLSVLLVFMGCLDFGQRKNEFA